ncbi:hypothetical protein K450DRAFT_232251 [Umbelopsis ramanniana AG]|uniref:Alpha-ketoglutarate-dependent dioxygenase AlkB-like domain-containing protein n=1 Tax=Umbelopsis ramanniana AG TaxID=1314678 RepID=A0AAD5EG28_UMBRA|nr:uncharacterized protein K450DRAFT_232251 [Umbelopsis ramanniana AG]KAI8581635.1 hypothetical protein K450DRAFT_232251 [Umbelopsis ramanniana AG]
MQAIRVQNSFRSLGFAKARVGFGLKGRNGITVGRVRSVSSNAYASLRNSPAILDSCFELSTAFTDNASSKGYSINDFLVYPDFVTKEEKETLTSICEKKLRRSFGPKVEYFPIHPDSVIHQYRECSASHWGKQDEFMKEFINKKIYSMFPDQMEWLDPHVLDLDGDGEIKAHVDNIEYSGSVVAGLCLLSPAIMTMRHKDDSNIRFDVLLEPGTFYIQRDTIRYSFTHEIRLSNTTWKGNEVDRSRRISLLFRDKKI